MSIRIISGNTKKDYPVSYIGGKAKGLIKLKRLEKKLNEKFNTYINKIKIPLFFIVLVGYNLNNTDIILKYADKLETDKFAVRSSSPYEDGLEYSFDGVFDSYLDVSRDDLGEALKSVKNSAMNKKSKEYAKEFNLKIDDKMAEIVQVMVNEYRKGIIYSKFPASQEVTKIVSWEHDEPEITLMRRELREDGSLYTLGHKLIEEQGLKDNLAKNLTEISYGIEKDFGFPVRIEYQANRLYYNLYLLQARSIAGIKDKKKITLPELEEGELLVGTTNVNGQGDCTLPAVVIPDKKISGNLSFKEVRKLDKKYKKGYILICNFIEFDGKNYDRVTPNKKAFVTGNKLGKRHALDIARQKGLLYLGTKNFGWEVTRRNLIKTGDLVRIVSDGVRGLLYKV